MPDDTDQHPNDAGSAPPDQTPEANARTETPNASPAGQDSPEEDPAHTPKPRRRRGAAAGGAGDKAADTQAWPEAPRQPETIRVQISTDPTAAQQQVSPTLQNPPPPVEGDLTLAEIKKRMPYLTAPFPRYLLVVGPDGGELATYNHPAIATTGGDGGSIEYIDAAFLRRRLDECLGPHWDLQVISENWESETTVCLHGRLIFGNARPDGAGGLTWEILHARESWDSGTQGRRSDGKNRAYALKDAQTGLLRRCSAWMGIGAELAERDTAGIIAALDQHRAQLFVDEADNQPTDVSGLSAVAPSVAQDGPDAELVTAYNALYAEMCTKRDLLSESDKDKLQRAPAFVDANGDYGRIVAVLGQMKQRLEKAQAAASTDAKGEPATEQPSAGAQAAA